ncbi:hypothetical protein THAOC_12449 [Thalassiosira oceanica]|uniref:Leucine-rich repeat-containing N-terminal plant-type domain-containing protein n=1 Tax=Thalassiosira oceanica TaxID=159749 RepID=K0SK23_THAOC|nr:hypothetical protein THAOC_12449 [Thalassiosira oceanica]|eukprot:EJK66618.1 hypothetical protein THAOC_12449 [Thalassiosira oceanica]
MTEKSESSDTSAASPQEEIEHEEDAETAQAILPELDAGTDRSKSEEEAKSKSPDDRPPDDAAPAQTPAAADPATEVTSESSPDDSTVPAPPPPGPTAPSTNTNTGAIARGNEADAPTAKPRIIAAAVCLVVCAVAAIVGGVLGTRSSRNSSGNINAAAVPDPGGEVPTSSPVMLRAMPSRAPSSMDETNKIVSPSISGSDTLTPSSNASPDDPSNAPFSLAPSIKSLEDSSEPTSSTTDDQILTIEAPVSDTPTKQTTTLAPTSTAPSSAGPVSARLQAAIGKLSDLSGEDVFNDTSSPQFLAAMWISHEDTLQLGVDDPRFEQRYIMALFYYAMDGNNWNQKQGWLSGESECYWFGIDGNARGCGGDGVGGCIARGDFVGDYDKICRLDMGRLNNLYGQLPSELGNLAEMRYFEIQDDYLYGTLPQTLGNWDKLHTFLVGGNFLSGGFPATFEGNEMLGTIFLDRNRFNTTFPNVFSTLKNLEWLDAEQNGFKGSLPASITSLKRLRILNLNDNSLTGHLPDEWDEDNLIEDFEVADNDFEGPLPHTLASARFLKDIHLSRNQLTGSLPTSYNNLGSLEELYLDGNQFTGELPQAASIYDGLQELSIHSNNFEGRFPTENFENTLRVKTLELHGNPLLTGVITDNICARRDPSLSYTRLLSLTAICDMIDCGCCDCYDFDGDLILIALPTRSPVQEVQTPTNLDETGEIIPQPTASPVTWSPISVGERKQSGITEQIEREVLQRGAVFFVMDDTDPRLKALHWILYSDKLQLGTQDANLNQRYVLAVMAFSLESVEWFNCGRHMNVGPNGMDNLFVNEDCIFDNKSTGQKEDFKIWLSSTDECEWFGVICSSDGVVRGLELSEFYIRNREGEGNKFSQQCLYPRV